MPKSLPQGIPIDWRVVAFTAGCSLAAGLLFGLAPALTASRVDVNAGLKGTDIHSGGRLQGLLAAGQVALSLVLLAGAGLMIRSFLMPASTRPGYAPHNVLTATVMLRPFQAYGPERQVQYFARLLAGIQQLPGVRYAAATSSPPMMPFSELDTATHPDDGPKFEGVVSICSVSANYFQVLGVPLVSRRFFDARDGNKSAPVVILNQTLARALFPGRNPIGHRLNSTLTVVGVVADIRHRSLDDKASPEMFLPFEQYPSSWITVLVRGVSDPSALAAPTPGARAVPRAVGRDRSRETNRGEG